MEVYRRCGVFERFLSLYSSPHISNTVREHILYLVFRATCVQGSTTLISRAGIISWIQIHMGLKGPHLSTLKLILQRGFDTSDSERIAQWSGGTMTDSVQAVRALVNVSQ